MRGSPGSALGEGVTAMRPRRFIRRVSRDASPIQVVVLSFIAIISVGAALLALPAASRSGTSCGFFTALFTSTSAACITGLMLSDVYVQWSAFGQTVILLLIQIGGLGIMSVFSIFSFLLGKKIGLKQRLILVYSYNLNRIDGVVRMVRHLLIGTLGLELLGAAVLSIRFIPQFGLGRGAFMGLFHAVSAFCNAGLDLMGIIAPFSSLRAYVGDPLVCVTVMALAIVGGLGFFVWEDVLSKRSFRRLRLHSKLVLITSGVLLIGGALVFMLAEWDNSATMGGLKAGQKVLAALFQSTATRTAGYYTIDQGAMTGGARAASVILMLIGGSSGSTAGGIKTVTAAVLVLSAAAAFRGRQEITVFNRTIDNSQAMAAIAITMLVAGLGLFGGIFISIADGYPFMQSLYEAISAITTVGFTGGIIPELSLASKTLLMIYMFFGRVGVITIGLAFMSRGKTAAKIRYPVSRVMLG